MAIDAGSFSSLKRLDHRSVVVPLRRANRTRPARLLALSFAQVRYRAFLMEFSARHDGSLFLSWAGATIAVGLLFGLATWLPFAKLRFLPSRLLLAAVALLPLARFWWAYIEGHGPTGGWLGRFYWFDEAAIQFVMAALAGVAIASGFRAKRFRPAPE